MRAAVALALLLAAGCAPAHPAFVGGSTTPTGRGDLAVGASTRVGFGALRNDALVRDDASAYREQAEGTGVAPAAYGRYGLPRGFDLGLLASGSLFRLEARREYVFDEDTTRPVLIYGLAPYAGYIPGRDDGQGYRVGVELPLVFAVEMGGVYEAWAGARVGIEGIGGDFADGDVSAAASGFALRAGGVAGMALGFRHVHVLAELTAAYERYQVEHGGERRDRAGLVLTPALALRLRL